MNPDTIRHEPPRIFVSYSHRGNGPAWKEKLLRALRVFEEQHLLDVWQDGKIRVSSYWDDDIKQAMGSAGLAVVLVTGEALESEYILNVEFPFLSDRQRHGMPVFPVICEACDWRSHEWLKATQAPNVSNPLAELSESAQEWVLRELATDIAEKLGRAALTAVPEPPRLPPQDNIYLDKFPLARGPGLREEELIGREQELALLDLAYTRPHTAIVSLVAWGGVGKTMLAQHWLRRLQREGWRGAERVYAWSFYSQGTKEDRQASEDGFLAHALEWFGVPCEPTLSPWDKGRLLAEAVISGGALLILDGIEPLQYPPGPMGGQLRAPGVQSLLKRLARNAGSNEHHGLCLITTREPLTDLIAFQRRPHSVWGTVLRIDLGNLSNQAGAALLHHAGAKKAGAAEIRGDDRELISASREVDGHALTLNLLGRFLARAHGGDIRKRDLVNFEEADREEQGGTTFKMLAAFENWFANEGDIEARALAILRMVGLFDRPAELDCLNELRRPPVIKGLTEPLFQIKQVTPGTQAVEQPLSDRAWNNAMHFLSDFALIDILPVPEKTVKGFYYHTTQVINLYGYESAVPADPYSLPATTAINAHPLIREYFGADLQLGNDAPYIEGHERIFQFLKDMQIPYWPDGLPGLEPLYHAVSHGCRARQNQRAFRLFMDRVIRGTGPYGFYTTNLLGAFSEDLAVMSCFFRRPWEELSPGIEAGTRAWLLNGVGFMLRGLGRVQEADAPLRAALDLRLEEKNWQPAANSAFNLSENALVTGNLTAARRNAEKAVEISRNALQGQFAESLFSLVCLAYISFQQGNVKDAMSLFQEAEGKLRNEPECRLLYGLAGAYYCETLLRHVERASWRKQLWVQTISSISDRIVPFCDSRYSSKELSDTIGTVTERLMVVSKFIGRYRETSLVNFGMCQLMLLRIAIYGRILDCGKSRKAAPSFMDSLDSSKILDILYRSRASENLVAGLLTGSWANFAQGMGDRSRNDLDEAWDIAERGPMRLHMADIHLYRARLFFREREYPWESPEADLAAAEKLIDECGYHRRDEELADAKQAILGHD